MTIAATWFKSSYSNGEGGACLEVSSSFPAVVPVRDSKLNASPTLVFSYQGWAALVSAMKEPV